MIIDFKTRDKLNEEMVYKATEGLTGIDKKRCINIFLNRSSGTDRLYLSNLFVNAKIQLRNLYKTLDYYYSERKNCRKTLEHRAKGKEFEQYAKYEQSLNDGIAVHEESLELYGHHLVDGLIPLIERHFTEHEIIQLVGSSEKAAEEVKQFLARYDINDGRGFMFHLIHHHGEYRWRRGRSKDFIDCPRWEMPLFNCVSDYILSQIRKSPKLSSEMDEVFSDMFQDAMVYATIDSSGNIVSTEKVIRDISVKELLKYFKDMQSGGIISRLKKDSMIDINRDFKLRRLDDGLYQVEDPEGKVLGEVIKR